MKFMKILILWLAACANALGANLTMTWDANSVTDTVTQYRIYQSAGTAPFVLIGSVTPPTVTFTAGNLASGVTYRHYVTAVNSVAESLPSNSITNTISTPPAAPANLRVTSMSSSRIDLHWLDASNNEDGFLIARATASTGPYATLASIGPGSESFVDIYGLSRRQTYCYRVVAWNVYGSASAGPVCDKTLNR